MKIEIITTAKSVEKTNYLLAQAIKSAENSKAVRDGLGLSEKDLAAIKAFSNRLAYNLLKALMNKGEINNETNN